MVAAIRPHLLAQVRPEHRTATSGKEHDRRTLVKSVPEVTPPDRPKRPRLPTIMTALTIVVRAIQIIVYTEHLND